MKKAVVALTLLCIAFMFFGCESDIGTQSQILSTPQTVSSDAPPESSSAPTTSEIDMLPVKEAAKEEAVSWTLQYMSQYGKASAGTFSEQIAPHAYTLRYDYRAPNAFGAEEAHVLYLIYTDDSNGEWNLYKATADGEELEVS